MSNIESAPSTFIFTIIGIIVVILGFSYLCNNETPKKSTEELYQEKVVSGSYSSTVTGTHEYRKVNGNVYVRNDTTTVIE